MDGLFSSGSERTRFLLFSLLGIFLGLVIIGVFWEGLNSCNPAILKRKGKFNPCGNIWIPFVLVLPTTKVVIFQGAGQRILRGGGGRRCVLFRGKGGKDQSSIKKGDHWHSTELNGGSGKL